MKKISEAIMCIILLAWIVVVISNNSNKNCCIKTAQEVYEYEGLVVDDCENCDEVD